MKRTMSYYGQRDSYGEYDDYQSSSRRNSNGFGEEQNSAKRKKQWRNRRRGSGVRNNPVRNNDIPVFKEPSAPVRCSPTTSHRSLGDQYWSRARDNVFRSGTPTRSQAYFDINDMPDFVEPHHVGKSWHWDNYFQDCKNWQNKHKLAYYRSRCMALEFENSMLFQQIGTLIEENSVIAAERGRMPSMRLPEIPGKSDWHTPTTSVQSPPKNQGKGTNRKPVTTSGSECDLEVTEEMMAVMEQSIRHKLNLNSQRAKDGENSKTEELKKMEELKKEGPKQPMGQKRKEELDQLYGPKSSLIQGLETAYQLRFNRNIDTFKPDLWMAVPLNPLTVA